MGLIKINWDLKKAENNIKKHRVGFEEAATFLDDPLAVIFEDETHSISEMREIIIGHSVKNRLLPVCFTERPHEVIRIISARPATKKEQREYEENYTDAFKIP